MARAAAYGIVEVHPVSHLFPMHGCKGSAWLGWQRQGLAAKPFRAESSFFKEYSARKPCRCLPSTEKASGNGNERLTGNQKKRKERNGLRTKRDSDASSVSHSFFFRSMDYCCRKLWADGKLRSFKKIRCRSIGRRGGSGPTASFRCRIHGRGFCRPTVCRVSFPRCGSPEASGGSLSNVPTLPCR